MEPSSFTDFAREKLEESKDKLLLGTANIYCEADDGHEMIASVQVTANCTCPVCLHRNATMFVMAAMQIAGDIEADINDIIARATFMHEVKPCVGSKLN